MSRYRVNLTLFISLLSVKILNFIITEDLLLLNIFGKELGALLQTNVNLGNDLNFVGNWKFYFRATLNAIGLNHALQYFALFLKL